MGVIFSYQKPKMKMVKTRIIGETLNLLTLLVVVSKCLAERIVKKYQ